MIPKSAVRKLWDQSERMLEMAEHAPHRYRRKLIWTLAQSVIAGALIAGTIATCLILLWHNPQKYWLLLAIFFLASLVCYSKDRPNRPCRRMFYLPRKQYPELYRKINRIAGLMQAPPIHRIYLNNEFTLRINHSFLFLPGLHRNELIIGYPLLCSLSSDALTALVAQNLGSMAGAPCSWNRVLYDTHLFWSSTALGIFELILAPWILHYLKVLTVVRYPVNYRQARKSDEWIRRNHGSLCA